MTSISYTDALKAYKNASENFSGVPSTKVTQSVGPDFGELVSHAAGKVINAQEVAEMQSAKALVNETTLDQLVSAVNNAEMSLRTAAAIRDKVISAYRDITQMPI